MPSDDDARRSWRAPALLGGAFGAVLLIAGALQFTAALVAVEGRSVLWDLRSGLAVSDQALGKAAEGIGLANRIFMQGDLESDRGFLLQQQAVRKGFGQPDKDLLSGATAATERALVAAPGDTGGWARLAYLYTVQDRRAAAARALRMSFLTGQVVPEMQASRLSLGLRLMPYLDRETVELLRRQVRFTWLAAPDALIPLARDPGTGAFVRDALAELDDADVNNFARRYAPGS